MLRIGEHTAAGYQVFIDNDGVIILLVVERTMGLVQTVAHYYLVEHERQGCPLCLYADTGKTTS